VLYTCYTQAKDNTAAGKKGLRHRFVISVNRPWMTIFDKTLQSIHTAKFNDEFSRAIKSLSQQQLNLQAALKQGSVALNDELSVMVLAYRDMDDHVEVDTGIFFRSLIAGCNCADDPTPPDTLEEYTEACINISKADGGFNIRFLS